MKRTVKKIKIVDSVSDIRVNDISVTSRKLSDNFRLCGYTIQELKKIIAFAKSKGYGIQTRENYCCHKFKDKDCKYKGPAKFCDKTKRMCIKLQGGLLNFGGWYAGKFGKVGIR